MYKLATKMVLLLMSMLLASFVWAGTIEKSQHLLAEGEYEEAVELLRMALKKNPQDDKLWEAYDEAIFKYLLTEKASETAWPRMRPHQFVELVVLGKKIAFIDARSPMETAVWYPASKILDTYTIPLQELPERLPEIKPEKYDYVVITCPTGPRAAAAAFMLRLMGYKNVYFFRGGNKALGSLTGTAYRKAAKRLLEEGKLKELPAWMK